MSGEWIACEVIRYINQKALVIRVCDTGAIVPIRLTQTPLGNDRPTALHPLRAVKANVRLGPFEREWFVECEIDIEWDTWRTDIFQPPMRYSRKRKSMCAKATSSSP
jgi:hypothetical protein